MGARSSRNTAQNNRSDGHLLEYFRNTFVRGGGAEIFSVTGGTITNSGGDTIHTFTGSQPFVVTAAPLSFTVECLIVAGGGGGSSSAAGPVIGFGGGGAGGLIYHPAFPVASGSYSVIVGGGGAAANNGVDSVFSTLTAKGGGYGKNGDGVSGGSGSGGGQGM